MVHRVGLRTEHEVGRKSDMKMEEKSKKKKEPSVGVTRPHYDNLRRLCVNSFEGFRRDLNPVKTKNTFYLTALGLFNVYFHKEQDMVRSLRTLKSV